jgi:hypothetical protein
MVETTDRTESIFAAASASPGAVTGTATALAPLPAARRPAQ